MPRTVLAVVLVWFALPALAAFKCVDEKGKAHYEDVPPAACANVVIYEVNTSGGVVRKIDPGQPAKPAEDPAKKGESDRAALDRERRDRTLLDTFASESEIDTARDRRVDLIKARMDSVERQLALVQKRRQQLEASPAKNTPNIRQQIESAKGEEATLERSIAGYRADMESTQKQFETDKSRWRELRERSGRR